MKTHFVQKLFWIFGAFVFSGCSDPLVWWKNRPVLFNANNRVVIYSQDGKPLYEREWRDRKKHGIWKRFNEAGKLVEEAAYLEGEKHGVWKTFLPDGSRLRSEGSWNQGKEDGVWREWHENGTLVFEGSYLEGKKHGLFRSWTPKGRLMEEKKWQDGALLTAPDEFEPKGSL